MTFLVLWELDGSNVTADLLRAAARMPDYAGKVKKQGKLVARYHVVGSRGGAWIYDVASNEELEQLLAMSPVYNHARYEVIALADMETPAEILKPEA